MKFFPHLYFLIISRLTIWINWKLVYNRILYTIAKIIASEIYDVMPSLSKDYFESGLL